MHIIGPLILGFLTAQDRQPTPLPAPMPSPAYILIAPGVLAEADVAKGNSAYYACLGNPATANKSFVCESQRSKAITDDASARFVTLIKYLSTGHTATDVQQAWASAKMKLQ